MTATLQPLSADQRDSSLDLLRGFAMAGVLFMFCVNDIGSPVNYQYSFWDEFTDWPKWILVEGRMYSLLILVFGYGFGIQLQKAKERGGNIVPFYLRRLIGLMVIGILHALLLSKRDILFNYGLAGLVLLPISRFSNRQLFAIMGILALFIITPLANRIFPNHWVAIKQMVQPDNYVDTLKYNWHYFTKFHQVYSIYIDMLFHFLLGFYFCRIKLLQRLNADKKLRLTVLITSLSVAVFSGLFNFGWVEPFGWEKAAAINNGIGKFSAATGLFLANYIFRAAAVCLYVSLWLLYYHHTKNKKNALTAFGQMAMSNYLIQSLVIVPFLLGFDLYNDMPPAKGVFLFMAVFSLQLLFSKWWMKHFYFGPFEWLLRSFTYLKWQPVGKPVQLKKRISLFDTGDVFYKEHQHEGK